MSDQLAPIHERKPSIQVMMFACQESDVQPILWGIEEEQIPATLLTASHGGAAELADNAAHASALNVGIAIDGTTQEVALHHRDLAGRPPLFTLGAHELSPEHLIRLGKNAARLVKGNPLEFASTESDPVKFEVQNRNDASTQSTSKQPSTPLSHTSSTESAIHSALKDDQEALVQKLADHILAQLKQY